ncbi:MAG: hypothetical protein NT018_02695 [Armatimonadetes bacterium]|nr:hypothetical protein [Armatimonadota bacterium]
MDDNQGSAMDCGSRSTYKALQKRINAAGLWRIPGEPDGQRSHLLGAEPFCLSQAQAEQLDKLGEALLTFYKAFNDLYLKAHQAWVNSCLDIGKGDDLLRHAAMKYQRRALPGIIRPDILMTSDGFVITELDSVPGGFGHLDCLSAAYEDAGWELIGSKRGIRDGFAGMLRSSSAADEPVCAIVVSDESVDYLPEMTYIARELREVGLRAYTVRPKEVLFTEDGLFIEPGGERLRVDVLYRFFELFDLLNIPKAELFAYAAKKKQVVVTPPYKHFLEEKMLLAMLHSDVLRAYWLQALGQENYALLISTTAPTWIMDNRPVPPHAQISGFRWRGNPIRDWREIASATQKERALVLKPSGFSPLAWGARGVKVGHDMPEVEWAQAVEMALASFDNAPYVLQPFHDTALFGVNYFGESADDIREMSARVRLCPYYFVENDGAKLGGALATACPKNKKLIHGMADAVMVPCRVG